MSDLTPEEIEVEPAFACTLRLMRLILGETMAGLALLEQVAERYGVLRGVEEVSKEDAEALVMEVRQVMHTAGYEVTCVLIQLMLMAGDPMLARVMGVQLERPQTEKGH